MRLTILTILSSKGAVAALVVLVRKDLKHERGPRQEEQQHGLEAVRREEQVGVVQVMHERARRPTRLVHQHLREEPKWKSIR